MQKYSFTKMNGAGNDFIILDESENPGLSVDNAIIAKMCDRRFGIGADGVMTIAEADHADFAMQYYNADGSTGSLCGNGSRCALMYYHKTRQPAKASLTFDSIGRHYHGDILNEENVKFFLADPGNLKLHLKVKAANQSLEAHFIDTGSPHVVVNSKDILVNARIPDSFYENLEALPVDALGREIRWLPEFAPGGTNVNFFEIRDGLVYIRTFERGVEAETFACGTGATATAIIVSMITDVKTPVTLVTKSGRKLQVDFERNGPQVKNVSLAGPAEFNYNGTITI